MIRLTSADRRWLTVFASTRGNGYKSVRIIWREALLKECRVIVDRDRPELDANKRNALTKQLRRLAIMWADEQALLKRVGIELVADEEVKP